MPLIYTQGVGAGTVDDTDIALADGKVLIGGATNLAAAQTLSGALSITRTGVATLAAASTIATSLTVPLVIGGTGTTDTLTLRTTSNAGGTTGADIVFQSGNNGATELARMTNAGQLLVGTATANTFSTKGLTLSQGAADNEILSLKSSDVAHGMTTLTETDTYCVMQKASAADGGIALFGYTDASIGVGLVAEVTTNLTGAKTTSSSGAILLISHKKNGTSSGSNDADSNLVCIRDSGTTRFVFDSDGSGHSDVEWTTYDEHDDLLALDQFQVVAAGTTPRLTPEKYGGNALEYGREKFEQMGIVGRDSWHRERGRLRSMVNWQKLAMLHHGAVLQLTERVLAAEARVKQLEAGYASRPRLREG